MTIELVGSHPIWIRIQKTAAVKAVWPAHRLATTGTG